jgi:hypothetical protein
MPLTCRDKPNRRRESIPVICPDTGANHLKSIAMQTFFCRRSGRGGTWLGAP